MFAVLDRVDSFAHIYRKVPPDPLRCATPHNHPATVHLLPVSGEVLDFAVP